MMRKTVCQTVGVTGVIFLLIPALVFGETAASCAVPPCDPVLPEVCETACDIDPCGPCGRNEGRFLEKTDSGYRLTLGHGRRAPAIDLGGWVESGIYTNGNGRGDNGPMQASSNRRTDFLMNQLYFFAAKELKAEHGLDWGFGADLAYGVDGVDMQSYGDESFDYDWGTNDHGYGLALYQLYASLGYKNLSVKAGKFLTPVGWEGSASKDNFFYSHSYCYWIEPSTHVGVLADYTLGKKWTLSAGWTAGRDVGFENRYDDHAVLAGLTYALSEKTTVYYWLNNGRENNGWRNGLRRFEDNGDLKRRDYFVQSLCFEWKPTDRFTYVFQYNLRNDNDLDGVTLETRRGSAYGINNHFLYQLGETLAVGLRAEWFRDNGGGLYITDEPGNYWEMTLGLNWNPCERLSIRPEIRFDWLADGSAVPYADGTKTDQVTGGFGMLYSF